MAQQNEEEFRRLAGAVNNREQFAAIFDQVAKGRTPFTFKVLALLRPYEPFLKAFHQAAQSDFLSALVDSLLHAGVLDPERIAADGNAPVVTAHLQAVMHPNRGFVNVKVETEGKLTAMRRLCCITVLTPDHANPLQIGTGFLVGPQMVLTSYHLIHTLLDDNDQELPESRDRLRVAFDEIDGLRTGSIVPVHEEWLAGRSKFHPFEDPQQRGRVNWDFDTLSEEGFDQHLDFALLRLSRTVGRERGFYTLDPTRTPITGQTGALVALLQHPDGRPLASTTGAGRKLWPQTHKTRLHHDADSADGSSGGLLVDSEFKPVGLHQCSYYDAEKKPLFNGAIPTACIAKLNLPVADVSGFDPVWKLAATDEPVIGREEFQQSVLRAILGQKRILTVYGNRKMGRSFTTKILREMLGTAEHHVVELSASKLGVTARATAAVILSAAATKDAAMPALPDTDEADSAEAAWISSELFPAFSRALAELAGHRTIWLVIDDLDRFPVANTSTRPFLETLYAGIGAISWLRIVLIGFQGAVPGAVASQVEAETLHEFNTAELQHFIERESSKRGIVRRPDEAWTMAVGLLAHMPHTDGARQAALAQKAADDARR